MGSVGASDRKDLLATWNVGSDTLDDGVLMVETYDRYIGVLFCVARIAEDVYLTCGWIGEEAKDAIKRLKAERRGKCQ